MTNEENLKLIARMDELIEQCTTSAALLAEANASLFAASQKIKEQADLIQHLSEDNLKLVAKLDEITGKKAPGNSFAA